MQDTWSDAVFREALQLIAEALADAAGFRVAAISLVREDRQLAFAAYVGPLEDRDALMAMTTPIDDLARQHEISEKWGAFRYLRYEGHGLDPTLLATVPDIEINPHDPEAWHPLDTLGAPIYDDRGDLRALLQVDDPTDGRRPGPEKIERLQRYAAQTRRAVLTAVELEDAGRRLALAARAREVVRNATGQLGAQAVMDSAGPAVMEAFDAQHIWMETMPSGDDPTHFWLGGPQAWHPSELALIGCRALALECWNDQRVENIVADPDLDFDEMYPAEDAAHMSYALELAGPAGLLLVPLGVGSTCVGYMMLSGDRRAHPWTAAERDTALDLGHDLGRSIITAKVFTRERQVSQKLRQLDDYRRTFVRTLAHELKNPLAAIFGHTAMTSQLTLPDQAGDSITAVREAADRMRTVIDDLLALSGLNDPDVPVVAERTDLVEIIQGVIDANRVLATARGLTLEADLPEELKFSGSPTELDRAVTNLVGNAIMYTPDGGQVIVRLSQQRDEIRISVSDTGPGVLEVDRPRLFEDFFRGSHPATRNVHGSGLGLPIVANIATRHNGTVEVESEPDQGSVFTLILPTVQQVL